MDAATTCQYAHKFVVEMKHGQDQRYVEADSYFSDTETGWLIFYRDRPQGGKTEYWRVRLGCVVCTDCLRTSTLAYRPAGAPCIRARFFVGCRKMGHEHDQHCRITIKNNTLSAQTTIDSTTHTTSCGTFQRLARAK